ncbi:MAG: HsdR family type I site-specific deoxyribonuclease [Ignavibacteria bacterium]|nr:HsdR family type I site-specific deoxyribonuclease [Ignavibacteria bacterium]
MNTPSFKEDHISQIPALEMLMKLGFKYLSQEEALDLRAGKTTNVILEKVLRKQLREINSIKVSSTKTSYFSDSNIESGIQALKDLPMNEGYIAACEYAYNLITLGKALEQNIDGDKKSFTLQYIDWKNPANNVFHVTEEFSVMRSLSKDHYRPDIVLFVNGIPLCVIECKRPDMKDPIKQAVSQHLRNQQEDGIRNLYAYSQILLSISTNEGRYATNGTQDKFWANWEEKFDGDTPEERNRNEEEYRTCLHILKNSKLIEPEKNILFGDRFRYVKRYFDELESVELQPVMQDVYLYGLCSPKRLMDFAFNFIIFDNGEKKIARYQQYFAVKKAMDQIRTLNDEKRMGGVIWHTQGSGKSLTMVMLAQAIALEKSIPNPKIILVTDRVDLDEQITGTFRKCGMSVENATTGSRLIELLRSKRDAVVTTVINKFETAVKKLPHKLTDPNIFVLVDEGHRTQYGSFNISMLKTLPNACFIAFTGTPLFRKDKNTLAKFGKLIDNYTVDRAVKDKAVVPLLYEARHAFQDVVEKPLDKFFDMICKPLNDFQISDLKKKFSRADQLNVAEQKIYAVCWDISNHFRDNFQGKTDFKGQLVCQSKDAAVRYKMFLDDIGVVSSEVLISPPDDREGEESAYGAVESDRVKAFWKKMMDEHGNPSKYENNIISRFKNQKHPEIIIVVDKLLTGFDEPKNTVLYLTRNLRGHSLLQAIARVNRIYPDKDYGYIIDYYGVLGALDEAMKTYSSFEDFDQEDLQGTFTDIIEEIKKLPQKHSELWDVFKTIQNKKDAEAFQQLLRDESIRLGFYDKLAAYARILKTALSSIRFHETSDEKDIRRYKEDLAFFVNLRAAVIQRYSDAIDYKQYEGQIQKLIDTHIPTQDLKPISKLVNIFDAEVFSKEVEEVVGLSAKADTIASRTAKHISEKIEEDPAFYKKFSELLKEAIKEYTEDRITEIEYHNSVKDIMEKVISHTDSEVPEQLQNKDTAKAFYGIAKESLLEKIQDEAIAKTLSAEIALSSDEIIKNLIVVDWTIKPDIPKKMMHLIGDYIIDEIKDKHELDMTYDEIDEIAEAIVDIAKIRCK